MATVRCKPRRVYAACFGHVRSSKVVGGSGGASSVLLHKQVEQNGARG